MKVIPLIRPLIPAIYEIKPYLQRSARANTYSNFGPNFYDAVDLLYDRTGRHVLPVTTGTAAIKLACETYLYYGDRVVIPDFTHVGTYVGVKEAGMIPILSDTDEETWALNIHTLYENIDEFDAFVVVAPFGYYVNIAPYERLAKMHKKKIIYDYAGAWGQFPDTEFPVCYSLHATKTFSTGEGGLISFQSDASFERCRRMSNFNTDPDSSIPYDGGGNYKMDEIRLAMLCAHMRNYSRIEKRIEKRRQALINYSKKKLSRYDTPSLCVSAGMDHIKPEDHADRVTCKRYYPLLSRMHHLDKVAKLAKSGDYFTTCLALPTDVNSKEQEYIIKEVLKR